jgi:hypothetical protein
MQIEVSRPKPKVVDPGLASPRPAAGSRTAIAADRCGRPTRPTRRESQSTCNGVALRAEFSLQR